MLLPVERVNASTNMGCWSDNRIPQRAENRKPSKMETHCRMCHKQSPGRMSAPPAEVFIEFLVLCALAELLQKQQRRVSTGEGGAARSARQRGARRPRHRPRGHDSEPDARGPQPAAGAVRQTPRPRRPTCECALVLRLCCCFCRLCCCWC